MLPITLSGVQNRIEKLFSQTSFPDIIQKIAVTNATPENAGRSSYRPSLNFYNFSWNSCRSLKVILLHLEFMSAWKTGNLAPFYSTEIRLLAENVFYNKIVPTGLLWLEDIYYLPHCNRLIESVISALLSSHQKTSGLLLVNKYNAVQLAMY